MPQFFVDKNISVGSAVEISGPDAKHIATVLRLKVGDWLVLSDGRGTNFDARINALSRVAVSACVESVRSQRSTSNTTLAIALIKHDRIETIIQKAVELGIAHIIPFHSERTIPRFTDAVTEKKLARWQSIANEAAKQSGLPFRPRVENPIPFDQLVERTGSFRSTILFWEGERERDLTDIRDQFANQDQRMIVIGPEGGFSAKEIDTAVANDVVTVSLGPQILRVETAVVAALAICEYESGAFRLS